MAYKAKTGDWTCTNCGLDKIFASRKACRKCGHARPIIASQPDLEETKSKQDAIRSYEHLTAMYMLQKLHQTREDTLQQQLRLNEAKRLEEEKKKKDAEDARNRQYRADTDTWNTFTPEQRQQLLLAIEKSLPPRSTVNTHICTICTSKENVGLCPWYHDYKEDCQLPVCKLCREKYRCCGAHLISRSHRMHGSSNPYRYVVDKDLLSILTPEKDKRQCAVDKKCVIM